MRIESGLMAELITGDKVRIVAVLEREIKVETDMGLAYISPRWIVTTYEPREGNSIYRFRIFDDSGIHIDD